MELTERQLDEIADNLECGFKCFYNIKTGEIKTLIDFDDEFVDDDEFPPDEDAAEIEQNPQDYIEFEKMESRDAFRMMVDFAESITDNSLRHKLINALENRKPFQNFKWHIDNAGDERQKWFDFRRMRNMEFVEKQIPYHDEEE